MRKARKRVLSTLLAVVLALGLMPSFAFATTSVGDTEEDAGVSLLAVTEVDDADGELFNELTNEFRIYNDYWANIVTEEPAGYATDDENKTVTISSAEGLVWWAKKVNGGSSFADYSVNITADINLAGYYWTPIDTATIKYTTGDNGEVSWETTTPNKKLDGTVINGNGHTISGLATATGLRGPAQPSEPGDGQNCYYYSAFIGRNDGALTIQNVSFDDASIAMTEPAEGVAENGSSMCAVVVAISSGALTMDSVSVTNSSVFAMQKASALLGMPSGGSFTVNKCAVMNCDVTAYFQVAPIVGYVGTAGYPLSVNGVKLEGNTTTIVRQGGNWSYESFDGGVYYGNSDYYGDSYYIGASETAVLDNVGESSEGGFHHEGSALKLVAEVNGYRYDTLAAAISAAQDGEIVALTQNATESIPSIVTDKQLTLDLSGFTLTIPTSSSVELSNGADLTVKNGGIVAKAFADGTKSLFNIKTDSAIALDDVDIDTTASALYPQGDAASVTVRNGSTIKCGVYAVGTNAAVVENYNVVITLQDSTFTSAYGYNESCSKDSCPVMINVEGMLNIENCRITGTRQGVIVRAGTATIGNSVIVSTGEYTDPYTGYPNTWGSGTEVPAAALVVGNYVNGEASSYCCNASVELANSTVIAENGIPALYMDANETYTSAVSISGSKSYISGAFNNGQYANKGQINATISGGYFTSDPSAYVADDYVTVESDEPGYSFMITEKEATAAEVVAAEPNVSDPSLPGGSTEGDRNLAEEVKIALTEGSASPSLGQGVLEAAANVVANDNTLTEEDGKEALEKASINVGEEDSVAIVVQPYLDIKITGAVAEETAKSITLDITPMYRSVATTADVDSGDPIVLAGDSGVNAVQIGEAAKLTITKPTTVNVPLSSSFVDGAETLYVEHAKSADRSYFYIGAVDSNNVLTFTNPNGFSEFTISAVYGAEAELNGIGYDTLSNALADAKDGDTVTVLKSGLDAAMSGSSRTVTLKNGAGNEIIVTINGEQVAIGANAAEAYTYTAPAGGGGIPAAETHEVSVGDFPNGKVSADPAKAEEGDKVTLTVAPDAGFELEAIAVVGPDGEEVELTANVDGTYSFEMPGFDVEVEASFACDGGELCPSHGFADVDQDEWYHDAIDWAVSNKVLNGFDDTGLMMPDGEVTRAQMAQILWNVEGRPAVSEDPGFSDVADSDWFDGAVAWAASEGIFEGYDGTDSFGPDDVLTREQAAAVLMRWTEANGGDVDARADLSGYPDASSVDGWAVEYVSWAVASGVISGVEQEDGTLLLDPLGTATRAQTAMLMMRLIEA